MENSQKGIKLRTLIQEEIDSSLNRSIKSKKIALEILKLPLDASTTCRQQAQVIE